MKNQSLQRSASYFLWFWKSKRWRAIHSPWLFGLLVEMRNPAQHRVDIEALRDRLKRNSQPVPRVDLGAGSTGDISTVAAVANRSLKRPKHARALAALSQHIHCTKALELGTSLGITSAYISAHVEQLVTVEGNPHLAELAQENWKMLGITNIESIVGNFDAHWNTIERASSTYDLIFIDGNHRGDALQRYIENGLAMLSPDGVIVCDDIHWSKDMEDAWAAICAKDCWTLQMDAFEWGLLTRNPALKREHVCVRF